MTTCRITLAVAGLPSSDRWADQIIGVYAATGQT